ncbi:MAG: cytochrome b/b6 domain-containing protein [Pseudomonadota bacterium]
MKARPMRANTTSSYGSVTKTLHWIMALLVLSMIPLGIFANGLENADPLKPTLFSLHKTVGIAIFFLALARILWAFINPKPANLHPERRMETFLAEIIHWLLYASLLIVPLSGWVHHAATTGFAPIWWPFGQGLPFVPQSDALAHTAKALHIIFERVLVLSFLLHLIGALKHHFLDKDVTLKRMLPGRAHLAPAAAIPHKRSPLTLVAAGGVYAIAITVGASLGLFAMQERAAAPALEAAESEWVVQDGTLGVTVKQLGSDVQGSFADWTAAINFNETPDANGKHGDVDVTISIPSLTLGSVTGQALGSDFLDAEKHQTAKFKADITSDGGAYLASGMLTIRETSAPVALPFELTLEGETAQMNGQTSVNRIDFGIGNGTQPTEGSLAFDVIISVALTATRGE